MNKIYGVGINDVESPTQKTAYNENKRRIVLWRCPYYSKWVGMLQRYYDEKFKTKHPHYQGCTVHEDWHRFSNFKMWMEQQNWQDKVLDKDLLVTGNTVYSPDTCIFVTAEVNNLITEIQSNNKGLPPGVHYDPKYNKYVSQCQQKGKAKRYLGRYSTPEEAYESWLSTKRSIVADVILRLDDTRIIQALKERYGL